MEIFLSRAKKFEELASVAFEKRMYDIAAFHIEQSLQLYLKYIFAKEVGYFPKTHSLKKLFEQASSIDEKFRDFYYKNEIILKDIEDSYVLARYLPREYSESEVGKMFEILRKFKEEFKEWI
ncbi:HEPN domain protein [Ferroglobus placidus DSM 10642]|uniref:HEPN domain protein n=1 Tax=Ferroglobus placidus (strain DSM 10642 / AEDII12DO) TaxID=589924 RepID=D3RWP8_FERPA|nr:HEPN domain protein [Ferroglobus placidus DSM 10642]